MFKLNTILFFACLGIFWSIHAETLPSNKDIQEQEKPVEGKLPTAPVVEKKRLSEDLIGSSATERLEILQKRFEGWTLYPTLDINPSFTSSKYQVFTIDLSCIGFKVIDNIKLYFNEKMLSANEYKVLGTKLLISPKIGCKVGLNVIELSYVHPNKPGGKDQEIRFKFQSNYQPFFSKVSYGKRGEIIVNGRKIFAVGGFRSGQTDNYIKALPSAAKAGLSWVHDYGNGRSKDIRAMGLEKFIARSKEYIQEAHRLGMGVAMSIPAEAVKDFDEPFLAKWISEISGEEGLWFWYIYDEPKTKNVSIEAFARTYMLIKKLDPNHPVVVVCNRENTTLTFGAFSDAIWADRYPITATGRDMMSMATVYADIMRCNDYFFNSKPITPILQLHDNRSLPWLRNKISSLTFPSDKDHRPTADEVKAMAHISLAAGTHSLCYYWTPTSWYSMEKDVPKVWADFSKTVHELRELEPIILSKNITDEIFIKQPSGTKVLHWARKTSTETIVGIVNCDVHESVKIGIGFIDNQIPSKTITWTNFFNPETKIDNTIVLPPAGVVILKTTDL